MRDLHGLPFTTQSAAAAESFNRMLSSYLGYRADLSDHVK